MWTYNQEKLKKLILMELKIADNVKSLYPDLKVSVFEVKLSNIPKFNHEIINFKKETENKIRNECKNPENLDNVLKYNTFYRKFDSKVPMEFQIKSIINNKEIPAINPILTCMFISELKNIILTAGHDLDELGNSIQVMIADGTEEYTKINEKLQKLKKNDIYALNNGEIISSVLFGPDSRTKITEKTKNFLFMVYSFGINNEEIQNHMNDILNNIKILNNSFLEISEIKIA